MTTPEEFKPIFHTLITEGEFKGCYTPTFTPGSIFFTSPYDSMSQRLRFQELLKLQALGESIIYIDPKGCPEDNANLREAINHYLSKDSRNNEKQKHMLLLEHDPA